MAVDHPSAAPGTVRAGGRTSRVRDAVFEATLAVFAEHGYAGLSVERVAEHSGVHKTTIYRRWRDRNTLLAAAVETLVTQLFPIPSGDTVADDLRTFGRSLVDLLTDDSPLIAGAVRALFSDVSLDSPVAALKQELYAARYRQAEGMVAAGIERGELPAGTDARELVGLIAAPIYYRKLVTGEPLDHTVADRAADTALIAVHAGACRQPDQ